MKWLVDTDVFFAALNQAHENHESARAWLDAAKPDGWSVSVETFLAAVRLFMNPQVMKGSPLRVREALRIVRYELSTGGIVMGGEPQDRYLTKAAGHRQVMDFYLVQVAEAHSLKLATFDGGTRQAWPGATFAVRA